MNPWLFLLFGYTCTVAIESPFLLLGLARRHSMARRWFAAFWLTLCTYPVVVLVLPALFDVGEQRVLYLAVAETFAPVAECVLFYLAFDQEPEVTASERMQDFAVIVLANLASFLLGEWIYSTDWFNQTAKPWLQSLGSL